MSNIFSKIGHALKVAAVAVAHGFASLFGKDEAEAFAKASLHILQSALGKIAVVVVQEMEEYAYPSSKKHAIAYDKIKKRAEEAGLEAKDSVINLLIELVVTALRQHFTLPDTDPAPVMPPVPEGV